MVIASRQMFWGAVLAFSCLAAELTLANPVVRTDSFELVIIHNNDMHARFVETDGWSNKCTEKDSLNHKCYGGFSRVAHL